MNKTGFVPLPEVGEYSEKIIVGELGLPVGFDEERLHLHVGRTEKVMHFGGIGRLTLAGYQGETTQYSYSANNIFGGIGTATGVKVASKAPTYNTDSQSDVTESFYFRWRDTGVKFNNAEISQRLHASDKWEKRAYDERGRAHIMDAALKSGLLSDIKQNEVLNPTALFSEGFTFTALNALTLGQYSIDMVTNPAMWLPVRVGQVAFAQLAWHFIIQPEQRGGPGKSSLLFFGPKLDRALAASLFMTRKLIAAK